MQRTKKIFSILQAGEMALTSQAFWTIAAEGPGFQVQKVGAQQEQEQNWGESQFSALAAQNCPQI